MPEELFESSAEKQIKELNSLYCQFRKRHYHIIFITPEDINGVKNERNKIK